MTTASPAASPELIDELVTGNRILFTEGVVDGFGHISVRHDRNPERFLIARSMAPGLVTAADIVECDMDGAVHDAQGRRSYVERFIHSAIYAARPDVVAVVHSHSAAVIPFGVTSARLRPICHMSGFLGSSTPVFEIRHAAGESTDLLIRSHELGVALAQTLGSNAVALMRGHGSVTVGNSIKQVVFRAIYTESNARLQTQALQLGGGQVSYLTDDEAVNTSAMNDEHLDRPWQMWKLRAGQS
jgi:HCOMODA/2-hydroxy-3-carboxy-muconic semialdehyde decarboxylase